MRIVADIHEKVDSLERALSLFRREGVDAVVFDQIEKVRTGSFRGGVQEYGLAENGVGYVYDAHNRALITDGVHARVEEIRLGIITGRIIVPATR